MKNTVKALAAATLLAFTGIAAVPASAGTLSANEAMQLCFAAKEANDMGISVKPMLEQVFISKGAPAYLANVALKEMKPYCPKAY